MYIALLLINIILMILIIYKINKIKLQTTKGQKVLLGFAIFCSVGSLVVLDIKEASIAYSVIAIILYGIYILKNGILSELNISNSRTKEDGNKTLSNNKSKAHYIYIEKDKVLYKKSTENNIVEVSNQDIIADINLKHQRFSLLNLFESNVAVNYIIDEEKKEVIDDFYNSFNDIFSAKKKWYISSRTYNPNIKASYGGASSSINQVNIVISYTEPKFLNTNVKVISIPLGKKTLYLLPDRALLYNGNLIESIEYKDLNIQISSNRFVWSTGIKPRDSEVIDYTYAHMNTKGGPDRRYSVNPRIPILNFTGITFSTNKLNEEIMISKSNACHDLVKAFQNLKNHKNKSSSKNSSNIKSISDEDPFLKDAIEIVIETGQASTAFIQRRFKVGYSRAERIIDQMELMGVISEYMGSNPRKILISKDEWEAFKQNQNKEIKFSDNELKEKVKNFYHVAEITNDNKSLEELLSEINNLVGLENVKEDISSLINLIKVRKIRQEKKIKQDPMSLHLVFSGNPGTGKTTVARIIAQIYHKLGVLSKGVFVEADRSELVAGYVGQTAIKVKEVCNSALGGILFIDEAYSLISSKDSSDFGKEAIDTLLKFMEDNRDDFIVIVAGYTDLMEEFLETNPGLKSRFNKFIHFDDYNPDELFEIYEKLCKDSEFVLESDAKKVIKEFFENRYKNKSKNFANARDVRNYFEKTLVNQANRIAQDNIISNDELQVIKSEDVKNIKLKD